ncbi:extensin-like domain-containing protein [Sphingobium cloacae]|uniref:Extensin n=1 Tax=Sphingobium cloacae TaxID=120107 RepID=A0A1E1F151_9SPHN|nr:extensin family protein [Sphingobium cloacae]BAV64245.1 extensin [Sphingobium cloacae]
MRSFFRLLRWSILLAALLALLLVGWALLRQRPQDLPWTKLDLAQSVGLFTGRKLAGLTGDPLACRALLDKAGIAYDAMPPRGEGRCAFRDGVKLKSDGEAVALSPQSVATSCPVAAALKLWEWQVVQPAAQRLLGQAVRKITHFGAHSCRRMYGRDSGDFSEHATADAIDISGFILEDGRRISVVDDWEGDDKDAVFLRAVRDGACDLFSTVLSPDYNAAHRDHLHLDQAERGEMGWRACR